MRTAELDHIVNQLKSFLSQMSSLKSKRLCSVSGGPYSNFFFLSQVAPKHAFGSVGEFIDHYRWMMGLLRGDVHIESRVPTSWKRCYTIRARGFPRNIIVQASTVTGIVDWSTAGFYPEYWEYCCMRDPGWMTLGWDHVLRSIFPGKCLQHEINVVRAVQDVVAGCF